MDPPVTDAATRDVAVPLPPDSVLELLADYGRTFGDDRAGVVSRLGVPLEVRAKATVSGMDSVFTLVYSAGEFQVVRRTSDQIELLMEFRVWGPLPGLPSLVVPRRTTRAQVLAVLGPAEYLNAVADSTVMSYQLPRGTDLIAFYVVEDTVRVLRWSFRMG